MPLSPLAALAAEAADAAAEAAAATVGVKCSGYSGDSAAAAVPRKQPSPSPIVAFLALDGLLALAAVAVQVRAGFCRHAACVADLRTFGDEAATALRFFVRSSLTDKGGSMRELHASFIRTLDTSVFRCLPRLPSLRVLHLDGCQDIDDDGLAALAQRCQALTSFSFYWNVKATDRGLGKILRAQKQKGFVSLNFSGVKNLGDDTVQRIVGHQKLEVLDITRCTQITDAGLLCVCECLDNLRVLRLYAMAQLSPSAFVSLHRLTQLEELDLCGCLITDEAVVKVLEAPKPASRLHTLNMTWNPALTDVAAMAVARCCPELRWLSYFGNMNITSAAIEALAAGPCGRHLRAFDCRGMTQAMEYSQDMEKVMKLFPALVEWDLHH